MEGKSSMSLREDEVQSNPPEWALAIESRVALLAYSLMKHKVWSGLSESSQRV